MTKKKRILFFMWSYSLGGGAEKILSTIVSNLNSEKYDIDILEMEHFDKGYEPVPDNVHILKPWQYHNQSRIVRALLWRFRIYFPKLTRKLAVKDNYDIEVSFTIMNPPFNFSKRKDVKKIAWIHGSIEQFKEDSLKRVSHKKHLADVDKIVAISNKTKQSIVDVYPEYKGKVVNIYNGYNFDDIVSKASEDINIEVEPNSICTIGRIEENKGSDRVLEVINELHKQNKKYHLYYIGSGDMEDILKKRVKKHGLEKYVHFLGYQKNPYKYLKYMKVLLSMSKQEGFPGVYVEALSLGVPFVSTDVGGAEELSQNGKFGKIIYNNEEAEQALVEYLDNRKIMDKELALKFIREFTVERQIRDIEEIFN
ncbi:glycosyltransferase [Gemella bergeri]